MHKYVIYSYESPSGKFYIGKTSNEKRRKTQHIRSAYSGSITPFHKAIRKYGIEKFTYRVIVANVPEYFVVPFEKYWVHYHKAYTHGYNCTIGGEGSSGLPMSDDTRNKISEKAKGRKSSEEARKKISASLKGNTRALGSKRTEDIRKKLSESLKGNTRALGSKHTEETKQKYSKARIGNTYALGYKHTEAELKRLSEIGCIKVINLDTLEVFPSAKSASIAIGVHSAAVSKAISKNYKCGGYRWMKLDDYIKLKELL